ncbi:MAG: iron-sulfur cluster assembly accessory protein [Candidatus Kapabacteria bacterium]|nr:iron-sulfur cluster assembly accessory protein [Candidatus Kapabacteria bacterium]
MIELPNAVAEEPTVVSVATGITGADENDNINISGKAIAEVKKIKEQNSIPAEYGLRVGVKGGGCSGMSYTLGFDAAPKEQDLVLNAEGVSVFVDAKSMFYLMGITLDYSDGLMGKGFTFNNPNATKTCGCGSSFGA